MALFNDLRYIPDIRETQARSISGDGSPINSPVENGMLINPVSSNCSPEVNCLCSSSIVGIAASINALVFDHSTLSTNGVG
jgi:hypothetical protein